GAGLPGDDDPAVGAALQPPGDPVGLVVEVADQLLEDVLEGDQPGGGAVLVDHDGEVLALVAHVEHQVLDRAGLGDEQRGPGEVAGGDGRGPAVGEEQQALDVEDAGDLVEVAAADEEAGPAGAGGDGGDLLGVGGVGDRHDVAAGDHHLLGVEARQLQRALQQRLLAGGEPTGAGGLPQDQQQL